MSQSESAIVKAKNKGKAKKTKSNKNYKKIKTHQIPLDIPSISNEFNTLMMDEENEPTLEEITNFSYKFLICEDAEGQKILNHKQFIVFILKNLNVN